VPEDELQSAKNRYLTSTYRQLDGNFFQMLRYGQADALGDWHLADQLVKQVQQVSSADLQRIVKQYFRRENRAVAIYTRKGGSEAEDPALAALPAEARGMAKRMLGRIAQAKDAATLRQMLERIDGGAAQMPEAMKPGLELVKKRIQARLAELEGAQK
jgi:hypothetical protein